MNYIKELFTNQGSGTLRHCYFSIFYLLFIFVIFWISYYFYAFSFHFNLSYFLFLFLQFCDKLLSFYFFILIFRFIFSFSFQFSFSFRVYSHQESPLVHLLWSKPNTMLIFLVWCGSLSHCSFCKWTRNCKQSHTCASGHPFIGSSIQPYQS